MAASLDSDAAHGVNVHLAPLRVQFPHVRWTVPEHMHVTLVFLGPTDVARVGAIEAVVGEAATRHAPFMAAAGEAGGRVDMRPGARRGGVAWLRLSAGGAETAAVSLDLDASLGAGTYDARAPRPHLTVARDVTAEALTALKERAAEMRVSWRVDRIALLRSHPGPRGSRYEVLSSFPLTRGLEHA